MSAGDRYLPVTKVLPRNRRAKKPQARVAHRISLFVKRDVSFGYVTV
jgi:hypothetical protein